MKLHKPLAAAAVAFLILGSIQLGRLIWGAWTYGYRMDALAEKLAADPWFVAGLALPVLFTGLLTLQLVLGPLSRILWPLVAAAWLFCAGVVATTWPPVFVTMSCW